MPPEDAFPRPNRLPAPGLLTLTAQDSEEGRLLPQLQKSERSSGERVATPALLRSYAGMLLQNSAKPYFGMMIGYSVWPPIGPIVWSIWSLRACAKIRPNSPATIGGTPGPTLTLWLPIAQGKVISIHFRHQSRWLQITQKSNTSIYVRWLQIAKSRSYLSTLGLKAGGSKLAQSRSCFSTFTFGPKVGGSKWPE